MTRLRLLVEHRHDTLRNIASKNLKNTIIQIVLLVKCTAQFQRFNMCSGVHISWPEMLCRVTGAHHRVMGSCS